MEWIKKLHECESNLFALGNNMNLLARALYVSGNDRLGDELHNAAIDVRTTQQMISQATMNILNESVEAHKKSNRVMMDLALGRN